MAKGIKNRKIEQTEAKAILDSVKDLDLTKVITEVSGLQVDVQSTLAGLSAALTNKIQQLEQMDTAIVLKEQRLQDLYGIENLAITLDEMKAQKEEEERQAAVDRQERAKHWMEEEAERQKKWKRIDEESEYVRVLTHKKWKDEFDTEVLVAKRNEATRQDMLSKSWQERELALKGKEQEFADLQKAVTEFDARLKAEVAKAESVLGSFLKKDYQHQMELLRRDAEAQNNLNTMRIGAQEKVIQGLHEQIKDLQIQLTAARTDAKDVATQALQSASGRQVVDALERVAKDTTPRG